MCYDSLYQRRILQIHTQNSRRELTNIRLIFSNTPGTIRFDSNMQLSREMDVIVSVNDTSTIFSPSTLVPNQEVSFYPMPTWNRRACMYVYDDCGDFGTCQDDGTCSCNESYVFAQGTCILRSPDPEFYESAMVYVVFEREAREFE